MPSSPSRRARPSPSTTSQTSSTAQTCPSSSSVRRRPRTAGSARAAPQAGTCVRLAGWPAGRQSLASCSSLPPKPQPALGVCVRVSGAGFVEPKEPPLMASVDLPTFDEDKAYAETPPDDSMYDGETGAIGGARASPAPRHTAAAPAGGPPTVCLAKRGLQLLPWMGSAGRAAVCCGAAPAARHRCAPW